MELFSKWKWLLIALGVLFIFTCITLLSVLGWASFRRQETPKPALEPVSIDYCGVDLTKLCVVSFSQNVFGDTMINLNVPIKKQPPFYLNVIRQSGVSRFECEWGRDAQTSIYCTGAPILLGEGFEIQVLSILDDGLMAQGDFTLTAYLVTTQMADGLPTGSETLQPSPAEESTPTQTRTPVIDSSTVTDTPNVTLTPNLTGTPTETATGLIATTDTPTLTPTP